MELGPEKRAEIDNEPDTKNLLDTMCNAVIQQPKYIQPLPGLEAFVTSRALKTFVIYTCSLHITLERILTTWKAPFLNLENGCRQSSISDIHGLPIGSKFVQLSIQADDNDATKVVIVTNNAPPTKSIILPGVSFEVDDLQWNHLSPDFQNEILRRRVFQNGKRLSLLSLLKRFDIEDNQILQGQLLIDLINDACPQISSDKLNPNKKQGWPPRKKLLWVILVSIIFLGLATIGTITLFEVSGPPATPGPVDPTLIPLLPNNSGKGETTPGGMRMNKFLTFSDPLAFYNVPKLPLDYIPRTLIIRNLIFPTAFQSDDMFVFSGIKKYKLIEYVNIDDIDSSLGQLSEDPESMKYITLDYDSHFKKLSAKLKNHTIHWVNYTRGNFIWRETVGNMTTIQDAQILTRGEKILEKDFINKLDPAKPICIAGVAGAGKTTLVSKLFHLLWEERSQHQFIFVNTSDFAIRVALTNYSNANVLSLLLFHVSKSEVDFQYFMNQFRIADRIVEICFDGVDEVDTEKLEEFFDFLKHLLSVPGIRVWVTTKPHRKKLLEAMLQTLCYEIVPLTEAQTTEFLVSYWKRSHEGLQLGEERLVDFAETVLNKTGKLFKVENHHLGSPLLSSLIASGFETQALAYANGSGELSPAHNFLNRELASVVPLFDAIIAAHLENVSDFENLAEQAAMSWLGHNTTDETLQNFFLKIPPHTQKYFIDYFVAKFAFLILNGIHFDQMEHQMLLRKVFQISSNSLDLEHPLICHFLDHLIKSQGDNFSFYFLKAYSQNEIHFMFKKLVESGYNFLAENILGHSENLFSNITVVLSTVRFSQIRLVTEMLSDIHQLENDVSKTHFDRILLEAVIKRGDFAIWELLKSHGFVEVISRDPKRFEDLLKINLYLSYYDTPEVLVARGQIAESLVNLNIKMLNEVTFDFAVQSVHPALLCKIISLSWDKLESVMNEETILHSVTRTFTAPEYHELLSCFPPKKLRALIDKRDELGRTPLHILVQNLEPLQESLEVFANFGADFNSKCLRGNTVLADAVGMRRSTKCLEELLSFGARRTDVNSQEWTALHFASRYGNVDSVEYFLKDFNKNIDWPDRSGQTCLHLAVQNSEVVTKGIIELLVEHGANVNRTTFDGSTPLQLAAKECKTEAVETLLKLGANVNVFSGQVPLSVIGSLWNDSDNPNSDQCFRTTVLITNRLTEVRGNVSFSKCTNLTEVACALSFLTFLLAFENGTDPRFGNELATLTLFLLTELRPVTDPDKKRFKALAEECVLKGADVNKVSGLGTSLLHLAAIRVNLMAVKFLLENGADVEYTNEAGQNAIDVLAKGCEASVEMCSVTCAMCDGDDGVNLSGDCHKINYLILNKKPWDCA